MLLSRVGLCITFCFCFSLIQANELKTQATKIDIEKSIKLGQQYLFKNQNPDGSWGSARRTKGFNVMAPVPSAHNAFLVGSTGLALSGLLESLPTKRNRSKAQQLAIDQAETWLLEALPNLKRSSSNVLYNVWGHTYGILAVLRLYDEIDEDGKTLLEATIRDQIAKLENYELLNGGWGYYDFVARTSHPSGSPLSFTTASVLHVLQDVGKTTPIQVSDSLIKRALNSIKRQHNPDFTYSYGEYLKMYPRAPINRPGGSLGRTVACNSALYLHKDSLISEEILEQGMDRLINRNLWLDLGRKKPIPHESWFAAAGYFFYYAHYYAGLTIDLLPEKKRTPYRNKIANIIVPLQEKDGSWWDYPLYDYHQAYGTGYALMTLSRCRKN